MKNLVVACVTAWMLGWMAQSAFALEIHRVLNSKQLFIHESNYWYTYSDDQLWFSKTTGLHSTAGSIGSKRFLLDLHAKLQTDLSQHLRFHYRYRLQESYVEKWETNNASMCVVANDLYFGLTGMARSEKWHNTIGVLGGLRKENSRWVELRVLFPDIYYNSKGPDRSEYITNPVEIWLDGMWKWSSGAIWGELVAGNRWQLEDPSGVHKQEDSRGRVVVAFAAGPTFLNIELSGFRYFNSRISGDGDIMVHEEMDLIRMKVAISHPHGEQLTFMERMEYIHSTGYATDPGVSTDHSIIPFHFKREDIILQMMTDWRFRACHWLRAGAVVAMTNLSTGASMEYTGLDSAFSGKLIAEYVHSFGPPGQITFGLSFDLDESDFGGGNLRLSIFPYPGMFKPGNSTDE